MNRLRLRRRQMMLSSLHLDLGRIEPAAINALFDRTDLPKLTTLGLCSRIDAVLLGRLADRPLARQLRSLTLERFEVEDVEVWHAVRAHFPQLQIFSVASPEEWTEEDLERYAPELAIEDAESYNRRPPLRGHAADDPHADGDDDDAFDDIRE